MVTFCFMSYQKSKRKRILVYIGTKELLVCKYQSHLSYIFQIYIKHHHQIQFEKYSLLERPVNGSLIICLCTLLVHFHFFRNFTLTLYFVHVALFPRFTFYLLHSFYVALFFVFHSFHATFLCFHCPARIFSTFLYSVKPVI